ncbi:MAG: hypothetical protein WA705_03025, partial [Candidatus Ozemobacteraceae bacterium]
MRSIGRSGPVSNAISRAFLVCFDFLWRSHRSPAAAQLDDKRTAQKDARSAYRGREQQACSPSLTGSARGKRALPIRPVEQ